MRTRAGVRVPRGRARGACVRCARRFNFDAKLHFQIYKNLTFRFIKNLTFIFIKPHFQISSQVTLLKGLQKPSLPLHKTNGFLSMKRSLLSLLKLDVVKMHGPQVLLSLYLKQAALA